MGQALGCCRAPGGAQSGEQIEAQVDPASGSAANGAPVASGAVPSAAAAAPVAGSPRFARRTSLSGYHSATDYSSDGDDEWHDALSDIGSGGCRARCCLCRTADEHLRMRPLCPRANASGSCCHWSAAAAARTTDPASSALRRVAEGLAEVLEEWEQEQHFHDPSVDAAIQVRLKRGGSTSTSAAGRDGAKNHSCEAQ